VNSHRRKVLVGIALNIEMYRERVETNRKHEQASWPKGSPAIERLLKAEALLREASGYICRATQSDALFKE